MDLPRRPARLVQERTGPRFPLALPLLGDSGPLSEHRLVPLDNCQRTAMRASLTVLAQPKQAARPVIHRYYQICFSRDSLPPRSVQERSQTQNPAALSPLQPLSVNPVPSGTDHPGFSLASGEAARVLVPVPAPIDQTAIQHCIDCFVGDTHSSFAELEKGTIRISQNSEKRKDFRCCCIGFLLFSRFR